MYVKLFEATTTVSGLPKTERITLSVIVIIVLFPQFVHSFIHSFIYPLTHSPFESAFIDGNKLYQNLQNKYLQMYLMSALNEMLTEIVLCLSNLRYELLVVTV